LDRFHRSLPYGYEHKKSPRYVWTSILNEMSLPDDAVAAESPNAAACAFDSNRASPVASLFTLGISASPASEAGYIPAILRLLAKPGE
jgi:hypothetical protein